MNSAPTLPRLFREKYLDVEHVTSLTGEALPSGYDLMQPKWDGRWCRVSVKDKLAVRYTSNGNVEDSFPVDMVDCEIIGERIGGTSWAAKRTETFIAFDLLEYDGRDLRAWPYRRRHGLLAAVLSAVRNPELGQVVRNISPGEAAVFWKAKVLAGEKFEGLIYRQNGAAFGAGAILREKRVVVKEFVIAKVIWRENDSVSIHLAETQWGPVVCKCPASVFYNDFEKFKADTDKIMGRRVEISGFKIEESGAMRSPQFVRFVDEGETR